MVDSAKMAIYLYPGKILADHLSIKSHLRDAPRDTHGATADYDDTALGTGTLTVHPWRAGPDCGKLLCLLISLQNSAIFLPNLMTFCLNVILSYKTLF